MADQTKLIEDISKLSVLEVSELVKALEEKFGVSAAPVAVAGAAAPAAAEAAEEKGKKIELEEIEKKLDEILGE